MPINWGNVGEGAITQGIGMLGGIGQANRQYHRQKKLNVQQYGHQRMLNQQGHDLQYDMWNKTNYKAQMEHMRAAGLNPALMYGSAGQGGQTGSQGGGSAQGGQAAPEKVMDMSNMMIGKQLELLDAQKEKTKEEGRLAGEKANAVGGYEKGESESRTGVNLAQTRKIEEEYRNIKTDTIKKIQETTNLKTLDEWNGMKRDIEMMKRDKQVTGSAVVDLLAQVGLDPINNPNDRILLNTLLTAWFGSTFAKNILQGIGGLKGNVTKVAGDKIIQVLKN